jgi:hypothetical protein
MDVPMQIYNLMQAQDKALKDLQIKNWNLARKLDRIRERLAEPIKMNGLDSDILKILDGE